MNLVGNPPYCNSTFSIYDSAVQIYKTYYSALQPANYIQLSL